MIKHIEEQRYFLIGSVERGPRYEWRSAYSCLSPNGGLIYPWLTWQEAQQQAKSEGKKAVLVGEDHPDAIKGRRIRDRK